MWNKLSTDLAENKKKSEKNDFPSFLRTHTNEITDTHPTHESDETKVFEEI